LQGNRGDTVESLMGRCTAPFAFAVMLGLVAIAAGLQNRMPSATTFAQACRVGCDGGRSLIRKAAGIEFPGWDPTTSSLIAEVEMAEKPELPALGPVAAPTAVLVRPDGYVAWVGDLTQPELPDVLSTWFGPPVAG
jgi:2-polyprenyl-6-methoxyphenol hydroxylase-like FAD-dependent oxidoreductase